MLTLAVVFVVIGRVLLYLLAFTTIRRLLEQISPRIVRQGADPGRPSRIGWAVEAASTLVPGARCLPKAIAAAALLSLHGYPAQLRIGVAKGPEGRLEGHSWVECQGQIVTGGFDRLDRYVPFPI